MADSQQRREAILGICQRGSGSGILRVLLLFFVLALFPGSLVQGTPLMAHAFARQLNASVQSLMALKWASRVKEQRIAAGVQVSNEQLETLSGHQQISLLNIDLSNPHVRLRVVEAHDHLLGASETVSSMAIRSGAIAGVNGDYFEIGASGDPLGMVEIDGQLLQSPASYDVLGITASKHIMIGPETFTGSVSSGHDTYPLRAINRYSGMSGGNLTLFTPALGASIPVRGATVALLRPVANSATAFTLQTIQPEQDSLPVLQGQAALVGSGSAGDWLQAHLTPGSTIHIHASITPGTHLVQAVGGGDILIKNGVLFHDPATLVAKPINHTALTAVGLSRDGRHLLLVVCNGGGTDSFHSQGLTGAEMAGYLLAHGVYQAILFDGGGSSTMVARLPGQSKVSLLSVPADHRERPVANGLFVYSR